MRIPAAKRKDRGEYTVKAVNKLGEDIASFLVTVTGYHLINYYTHSAVKY